MKRVLRAVLPWVVWCLASPASAQVTPEVGWWWNPEESGRGFFIESQGGITYFAAYLYEAGGRPTWLIGGGPNPDPSSFQGQLVSFTGGQTLFGDYQPPAPGVEAGAMSLTFSDSQHGTFTWPGGSIPIQRMAFGPEPGEFQPLAGLWWDSEASGTGYNVEVQGDALVVVAFVFDDAGQPVWYLSAGRMSSPTRYEGAWNRFANGQATGAPYQPPSAPVEVGRLAIEFLDTDEATFTFTEPTAAASSPLVLKRSRNVRIRKTFAFLPPPEFAGEIEFERTSTTGGLLGEPITIKKKIKGPVLFGYDPVLVCLAPPGRACQLYTAVLPASASLPVSVHVELEMTGPIPGTLRLTTCKGSATKDLPWPSSSRGDLQLHSNGRYIGEIQSGGFSLTFRVQCEEGGIGFDYTSEFDFTLPISGTIASGGLRGRYGPQSPFQGLVESGRWNLGALYPVPF